MKSLSLIATGLLVGQVAAAAPNWQVTSFSIDPQDLGRVLAAADAMLGSPAAKDMPGTVSLMANLIDGNDPATHSFISAFDSLAEREAFFQKLQADPAWGRFLAAFGPLSEPGSTSRMTFLNSWGEESVEDVVWEIHAFSVSDASGFTAAIDALMASETGKGFPGRVHLSGVSAAGMTSVSHLVSVGFQSEAEAEAWNDRMLATQDWADYVQASEKVSEFRGTWLIRTVKTWGATGAQ